jgi:hypothetical protein
MEQILKIRSLSKYDAVFHGKAATLKRLSTFNDCEMKTTIFLLLIMSSLTLEAQTDSLTVNQINDLQQSLQRVNRTINVGRVMVVVGFITAITMPRYNMTIATIGGVIGLIGIPVWIAAVGEKNDIQIQLIKYQSSIGIGVKFKF